MDNEILKILRDKGLKKTPLRVAILEEFFIKDVPLLISDLQGYLEQKGYTPNITSLYRQMEVLEENGVIQSFQLQKKGMYYEISSYHHHHFVCQGCEEIECMNDPVLEENIHALEKRMKEEGKKVFTHHFSLSGYCSLCV